VLYVVCDAFMTRRQGGCLFLITKFNKNARLVESIQRALEEAGVEFVGTPDDRPGVRLK